MALDVRELTADELDPSWQLGRLAFGGPAEPPEPLTMRGDISRWGAFDDRGRLVGKASDLHHEQWWGGRVVSVADVGGVAVEPEQRGRGAGRAIMTALLHGARDRGAVGSNLFCTSAAVYRALGYDVGGWLRHVRLATALLPARPAEGVTVRAASGRDWPSVRAVYDEVARTGQGLLTRRVGPFPADPTGDALPDGVDGVSLAEDRDGRPVGYALWERGRGYRDEAVLTVLDCLALTAPGASALVGVLSSWQPVAPTLELRPLPWADPVSAILPVERAREDRAELWLHRVVDAPAAVAARGWAGVTDTEVRFRLVDPLLPWNDRSWRLVVRDGAARLEPVSDADATLHTRGWALLWCGQARTAQLRHAGWLTGGSAADDAALDATLGSGGPAAVLDYF